MSEALWVEISGERFPDGESSYDELEILPYGEAEGVKLVSYGNQEFYLAESEEAAGKVAREYWADMAAHDPDEFVCIVGKDTLVSWALGQMAGPGSIKVASLGEWLDLTADHPYEHLAGYDGETRDVDDVSKALVEELGFTPAFAYRAN